ncbi:MAG: hypothetical protein FI688_05305 [SAR202 cluster bacterium]|nr:hypothetical protein [Chloroflexota bacterium]MQG22876.1 hypothetical protein [SAR202 cluster bacterium]|tara:strand:+ start:29533 stop:29889 length:357 start_codon:yes stop_codon:yes gene_type:complete
MKTIKSNFNAQGLVRIDSDDLKLEIKFESSQIYLNVISVNPRNLKTFFNLSDLRKLVIDVADKLAFWKFDLTVTWEGDELAYLGQHANPNILQKFIVAKNVEIKNLKGFAKLLGGRST